jgi:branched-subunit amino acid transport protein
VNAWIALIGASLLTFLLRAGPSMIAGGVALPRALEGANRFTVPALMGAVASRTIAAQAAAPGGIAVLAAVAIAVPIALRRTRSMALTVTGGVAAYFLAAAALG